VRLCLLGSGRGLITSLRLRTMRRTLKSLGTDWCRRLGGWAPVGCNCLWPPDYLRIRTLPVLTARLHTDTHAFRIHVASIKKGFPYTIAPACMR
jgi:hypothetical protein